MIGVNHNIYFFKQSLVNPHPEQMNETQFDAFIVNKSYKTSIDFNNNPKYLLRLINYVKNLPLEQKSFDIVYDLLKFYRTPLFIACKSLYQKIEKNYNQGEKYRESIQDIASYVKAYLQDYKLDELNYFFLMGISKKKRKILQKSDKQIQFLNYILRLGTHITKLKKQVSTIKPQILKLQLDQILAEGLQRKLNTLQMYYQQYFKNQADRIYKEYYNKINENSEQYTQYTQKQNQQINKIPQPKPQFQSVKKLPLCCRAYFFDQQAIKQPENLVLEYKNYYFPFGDQQIKILRKTVCGFLNADGGNIMLGIHQDVNTKKRKVLGMQINQLVKQNILFSIRKDIMDSIEPDILVNKLYSVNFVPVKQSIAPYHYISGRYVVKITVKFGLRNQIYSYKYDGRDNFAFRTQNQVIHRQGRDILNAYRERLKNPLANPIPIHEGPCIAPEQGRPLQVDILKKVNYQQNYDFPSLYSNYNNGPSSGNVGLSNSQQKQKKKYKQKDAMDFILQNISQTDLVKQLNNENLSTYVETTSDPKKKLSFIKLKQNNPINYRIKIIELLCRLESQQKCQFYQTQRGIQLAQNQTVKFDKIFQILLQGQFKFNSNSKKKVLEFKSTEEAIEGFLYLKQNKIGVNFIGV